VAEHQPELREGPRVPFFEPVHVSGSGASLDCRGLDLSVAGIGIELSGIVPWALGGVVQLRFDLPGGEALHVTGWVARRFEHERHLERYSTRGVGISFEGIGTHELDAIARFVRIRLEGGVAT
jgi:hypothetical protein